jgi:iron complex transport system substrate-binding protein
MTGRAAAVVTLAPSLTELVYAAGAQQNLVGVSAYSDFPEAARSLPKIADASGISFEALLALKPNLVLAWKGGTRPADIARLTSLGINVFVIEVRTLADVPRAVRTIGQLVARPAGDDTPSRFATTFESRLKRLQISQLPLMTVNGEHLIAETIKLCGGENVFSDAPQVVVEPSREELLKRGADAILRPASIHQDRARDQALYAGLSAYQHGRIYPLNADWILRPGPRILLAAEEICAALDRARIGMAADVKVRL